MKAADWLLAPYWTLQLGTGAKSFCDNPLIGSRRLNALGLHAARMKWAHRIAASRRRRLAYLIDPADRVDFDRDGFVEKRDFLPAPLFERLRDGVMKHKAPARETIQGDTITRRFALDPAYLAAVPEVCALLLDRRWRGLIRYAGSYDSEPLCYVQSILSNSVEGAPDPQTVLHADTFHPTVKAWLFLTDVAEDEGPFTYVPGSHRPTPERLAWERALSLDAKERDRLTARGSVRVSAEELPALGLPPPHAFAVPANTLVVADTCGFHARGRSARPTTRVEIWAFGRRTPFLPWAGFDPLSLPGIAERRIGWSWRFGDFLDPWIGQQWHKAGTMTPANRA